MTVLERRFDDAGNPASVGGRIGETPAAGEASTARRLRLGLTGLAAIFLLVLIAAAGLRPSAPTAAAPESQAEPLAVLGVAPGAAPAAEEAPAATARPAAAQTGN